MTLDGHEDWVRWGRNRVGLRGDMQLEVGGGIRKKINMMRICWCFFGDWKVFASAAFFLMVGKTRSWIALPFGKRHPKLTCVYVCRWLHILMIWYLYTRTIFDVYIYIYVHVHANKKGYILYITSIKIVEHAPRRTANFSPDGGGTWFSWSLTLIQKSGEETTFWIHKTLENNGINCQPQLAKLLKDI